MGGSCRPLTAGWGAGGLVSKLFFFWKPWQCILCVLNSLSPPTFLPTPTPTVIISLEIGARGWIACRHTPNSAPAPGFLGGAVSEQTCGYVQVLVSILAWQASGWWPPWGHSSKALAPNASCGGLAPLQYWQPPTPVHTGAGGSLC